MAKSNLTLTSVVFEWDIILFDVAGDYQFNFNKCCIWIG